LSACEGRRVIEHPFVAILVWLIATFAPPVVAVMCWMTAKRIRNGWMVHAAFVPILLMLDIASINFYLWSFGDDGTGSPALMLAFVPTFIVLTPTIGIYLVALILSLLKQIKRKT